MTDLIAEIRALVAREGWDEDIDAIRQFERRILASVEVDEDWDLAAEPWIAALHHLEVLEHILTEAPPFLRSRDAAALLEDVLLRNSAEFANDVSFDLYSVPKEPRQAWHAQVSDLPGEAGTTAQAWGTTEPAARTIAALEALRKLGLLK